MGVKQRLINIWCRPVKANKLIRLRFMFLSSEFVAESMLVPDLFQSSNNCFAVDLPRFPRFAIRVTANGMYPQRGH